MGKQAIGAEKYPRKFRAAVWMEVDELSSLCRGVLEELGFKFSRSTGKREFSRIMFVVPLPRYAYVYIFTITEPVPMEIKFYSEAPTSSGVVHFVEIVDIDRENVSTARKLLKRMADKMDRKPWKFSFLQRFRYGLLAPEFVSARSRWRRMGVE